MISKVTVTSAVPSESDILGVGNATHKCGAVGTGCMQNHISNCILPVQRGSQTVVMVFENYKIKKLNFTQVTLYCKLQIVIIVVQTVNKNV